MNILAISGSASISSSNLLLLEAIKNEFKSKYDIEIYKGLRNLPLFKPEDLNNTLPPLISQLGQKINDADAIIISTPEYTHNIPAIVKNMIDWFTSSGEFVGKKVLPITFTPHEPRGKWAMESLTNSLKALDADIVVQLPLYKSEVTIEKDVLDFSDDYKFMLSEALSLLES